MKSILVSLLLFFTFYLPGNAQSNSFCGKKMIGYIAYWNSRPTVDYANLTHAFFSFLKPKADGSLTAYTTSQQAALDLFLTQTKQYGCKRFISLSDAGTNTFPVMAANPAARQKFIANVIAFCKNKQLDGIDLDWEYMNNETQKKNYTALLKEFRLALSFEKIELTATVGFGDHWGQWIENEALQQVDWIQVMAYDQTGLSSKGATGNHASFEHYVQAQQYWTSRGFEKEKIVMGLPFYGYRFTPENGGRGKAVRYAQIAAAFPQLNSSADQTPGKDGCYFNGSDLIYRKTMYALENGFAGVMVWEMSQDAKGKKSLHQAIIKAFSAYCGKK